MDKGLTEPTVETGSTFENLLKLPWNKVKLKKSPVKKTCLESLITGEFKLLLFCAVMLGKKPAHITGHLPKRLEKHCSGGEKHSTTTRSGCSADRRRTARRKGVPQMRMATPDQLVPSLYAAWASKSLPMPSMAGAWKKRVVLSFIFRTASPPLTPTASYLPQTEALP